MAYPLEGKEKGVTLIELVLVMTTVAIMVSLSSMYIREIITLWNVTSFRNEVVGQGRMSMMRMAREIREVNNTSAVVYANATRFRFIDTDNATIEYNLTGTNLMRNANIMAGGVSGLAFSYYDNRSQQLASPKFNPQQTDIVSVGVNMTLSSGSQSKNFSMRVYPRNLMQ